MFLNIESFEFFDSDNLEKKSIQIFVSFKNQRFKTSLVQSNSRASFQDIFLLKLQDGIKHLEASNLLDMKQYVHFLIVKLVNKDSRPEVISSQYFDWRAALVNTNFVTEISCFGIGLEQNIEIGKLKLELNIVPEARKPMKMEIYTVQLKIETNKMNKETNKFIFYSKQWLKDYKETRKIYGNKSNFYRRTIKHYKINTENKFIIKRQYINENN